MPQILMRRSDIPGGILQIDDLKPHSSQKNNVLEPAAGQTHYVKLPSNQNVGLTNPSGAIQQTAAEYTGLSAYLVERIEDQSAGEALTAAIANDTATLILARVTAGTSVTAVNVAADLVTSGADGSTTLSAGDSYGTILDVLQILAGRTYTVPQGTVVQETGGAFVVTNAGAFDTEEGFVATLVTGSFNISVGSGFISTYLRSDFNYLSVQGAALSVLADDGSLYTV